MHTHEAAADLRPAALAMSGLVRGVADEQLGDPTPCPDYRVGDLLDHIGGLALAFTRAARKESAAGDPGPSGDGSRLPEDWRETLAARLEELADAWRDPGAWEGTTTAGGVEMSGAEAGIVALDELVLHGWDLAVATGAPFQPDADSIAAARSFVEQFSGPGTEEMRTGLFGPELTVPPGASPLEELLALAGRDPAFPASGNRTGPESS